MPNRVLVKLRPSAGLRAAESRANLRPLGVVAPTAPGFGLDATPRWHVAELPDGAPIAWDVAHARVADQLGVDESDVVFAEPDVQQSVYRDENERDASQPLGATECVEKP